MDFQEDTKIYNEILKDQLPISEIKDFLLTIFSKFKSFAKVLTTGTFFKIYKKSIMFFGFIGVIFTIYGIIDIAVLYSPNDIIKTMLIIGIIFIVIGIASLFTLFMLFCKNLKNNKRSIQKMQEIDDLLKKINNREKIDYTEKLDDFFNFFYATANSIRLTSSDLIIVEAMRIAYQKIDWGVLFAKYNCGLN